MEPFPVTPQSAPTPPLSDGPAPTGFFGGAIGRPIGLLMLLATLLVVGVLAYTRIPIQLIPSGLENPRVWVWIPTDGASARENEDKVARPIEEELRTLAGITRVRSYSSDGVVRIAVSFDPALDLTLAKAEVRDRIERVRPRLPAGVDLINFWSEDASQMPLSWFGILHQGDSDRTDFLVQQVVVPRLEALSGIAKIDVFGDLEDSVRILLDEERVLAAGVDIGELIGRLSREAGTEPLGEIDDGGRRFLLRADLRPGDLEALANYPVRRGLVLGDLGEIVRAKSVRSELSRINGDYAYFAVARKEAQANVVAASRSFRAAIEELGKDPRLAGELSFLPFFVQGDLIESSLDQLKETALGGGLLAVGVLLVFLRRLRLTLCVALAIPISVLIAITVEYFAGRSFNLLTMTGITLALGMLVDNAVVVVENIARLGAEGHSRRRAAEIGAREIALAVTLATLTTVVVFLPLIFMGEDPQTRTIFGGIGLPLCISLLASLLVAVVFLPAVAARLLGERPAAVARFAARLEPVAALPARAVATSAFALGRTFTGSMVALNALNRGTLAVLAPRGRVLGPLGWILRAGIAFLVFVGAARMVADSRAELVPWFEWNTSGGVAQSIPMADLANAPALWREGVLNAPFALAAAIAAGVLFAPPYLRRRIWRAPPRKPRGAPAASIVEMLAAALGDVAAWSLRHRLRACTIALLALSSVAIPAPHIQMGAFATEDSADSVRYWVDFTSDFTLAEAAAEMARHETALEGWRAELSFKNWMTSFSERGGTVTLFWDEPLAPSLRKSNAKRVRELAPRPVGHDVRFEDNSDGGASRTLLEFHISGPESSELEPLALRAAQILKNVPGLREVRSPLEDAPRQVELSIDRDVAQSLGVNSQNAFQSIAWGLRGFPLPRYWDDGREVPLYIEYDQEQTAGLDTLRDLKVWGEQGPVALTSFASIGFERGSREIYRDNGRTTVSLAAEIDDPVRALELERAGYLALGQLDLPRGYALGSDESLRARQSTEIRSLLQALLLSLVLVFLLMGILFESIALPFSVLVTVPYAFLGAFWTLGITGTPMDAMAWIGLIILGGVVVNNGIVLIDRIHRLRGEGVERTAAVVRGVRDRVRPVLMTAGTTVVGLLPMMLAEPASDSIDYRGLAAIVGGGLAASTLFTLWVVPLAYTLIEDGVAALLGALTAPLALLRGWRARRRTRLEAVVAQ